MRTNDLHIELPASKSLSNRWLVLNYLLKSPFILRNLSDADDTQLLADLLNQLRGGTSNLFYCRNAGTVARFMMAILATTQGNWRLTGDSRLRERPMAPLISCLRNMGCGIVCTEREGFLPVDIAGHVPQFRMTEVDPTESSQYVSAMMLVGCALPNGVTLTLTDRASSRPYIDMTGAVLTQAGIRNAVSPNRRVYRVEPAGCEHRSQQAVNIERDWSSASYIYAAAALLPGMRLRMQGLTYENSCQGDRVAKELFGMLGVETREVRSPYRAGARSITIVGTGECPGLLEYNFIDCPDLLPAVLVTCAALGVKARLKGVKNLRLKESDRLAALQTELCKMNGRMTVAETEVVVYPSELHPVEQVCAHNDHRIAMAFGVLSLRYPQITIDSPDSVSKSYPSFWSQIALIRKAMEKQSAQ